METLASTSEEGDSLDATPKLLESSVRCFIDEHMQSWLQNFVSRFASVERRFANLEQRFVRLEERISTAEKEIPTKASITDFKQHAVLIADIQTQIGGGPKSVDSQLKDVIKGVSDLVEQVRGEHGIVTQIGDIERNLATKADTLRVERIQASLAGDKGPQAQLARVEKAFGDELRRLGDVVGRKLGRDELYYEMMARHMLSTPRSMAAERPRGWGRSVSSSRPYSSQ